jgi:hypothetical protein
MYTPGSMDAPSTWWEVRCLPKIESAQQTTFTVDTFLERDEAEQLLKELRDEFDVEDEVMCWPNPTSESCN